MVETVGTVEAAVMTALIAVGVLFLAIGTIGLLRFPNVYNRMHATSKPTTLGTAAIFTAAFVRFGPGSDGLTSLLGIAFLFLTVPTGAHMIARSAERMGVPFEEGVTWPAPPVAKDQEDPDPVGVRRPDAAAVEDDAARSAEGAARGDAADETHRSDVSDEAHRSDAADEADRSDAAEDIDRPDDTDPGDGPDEAGSHDTTDGEGQLHE